MSSLGFIAAKSFIPAGRELQPHCERYCILPMIFSAFCGEAPVAEKHNTPTNVDCIYHRC